MQNYYDWMHQVPTRTYRVFERMTFWGPTFIAAL